MPTDKTTNLQLPYIYTNQAQKELNVNEALTTLDTVWNAGAISKAVATPPSTPATGDVYIVAASPTGSWAGKAAHVAYYNNGWRFIEPKEGIRLWVNDEDKLYTYNGTAWTHIEPNQEQMPQFGVNATPDSYNKFVVASDAVLFNHNGTSTQVKLNKQAASNSASFLYQTNYSGRAEIGLTGDDDFHFKVSPDGSTWNDAITINKTSGDVSLNSHKLTNVTNPTSAQDAATKSYVDTAATIADNGVTNAKLRDSAALSVMGRSANTSGDPADIAASSDNQVLRRSGASIGFGAVNLGFTSAVTVPGSNTYILYNSNGAVGASSNFTYNNTTSTFGLIGSQTISGNLAVSGVTTSSNFPFYYRPGATTDTDVKTSGVIDDKYSTYTTTTNTEELAYQYTVGKILIKDGDAIRYSFAGSFDSATGNKTVKIKWNTTTVIDTGAFAISTTGVWKLDGWLIRNTSSRFKLVGCLSHAGINNKIINLYSEVTGQTFTAANLFKLYLQDSSGGVINLHMGKIEFLPAYVQA